MSESLTSRNGEFQQEIADEMSQIRSEIRSVNVIDKQEQVLIAPVVPKLIRVEIVGLTPLLVCAWSKKAMDQMLEKQMKKGTRGKEAKDPEQCYRDSLYVSTEGWTGGPAGGMKGCLVNACRATDVPMTMAKRMIFIKSQGHTARGQQLIRIYGEHQMHQGMVRIDNGKTTDIRFRAVYPEWSAILDIEFLASVISAEQVCNLVELAGFCEGYCEQRPGAPKNNTGDNGRFKIKRKEG